MAQLKLIAMSVLLTVLVWVSADQLLLESTTLPVTIEPVATGEGSYTVSTPGDRPPRFQVTLTGPQQVIARFKDTGPLTIPLPIETHATGPVNVNVLDALRKEPGPFAGLTVDSVSPAYLEVVVDRDMNVSLPVWVDKGALDYDVDPSVEPDHVQVTISERRYRTLPEEKRRLTLRAESLLKNKKKGELLSFAVPLEAKVEGVEVKVAPPQVNLRATVRELRVTDTIAAVPIRFSGSVDLWNEFQIELRNRSTLLTQPITVKGPAELVARLVGGDIKVTGQITISRDDTLDAEHYRAKKPVFVGLPAGVELADPDAIEGVEFRLTRIEAKPS
jgi:YbbR domain-containing protein